MTESHFLLWLNRWILIRNFQRQCDQTSRYIPKWQISTIFTVSVLMHRLKVQVTGPLPPTHERAVTKWKRKSYTRSHYMENIFNLPSQYVSFGGSFIGHVACPLPPQSHPRHFGLYSAHGLLVLGFRNNLGFTRLWPYAQTPAMLMGR